MIATKNRLEENTAAPGRIRPFTVLVVDDENHIVSFIRIRLRLAGLSVLSAGSTYEALSVLRQRPVDLAIVDLMMPGLSGFNLIEQMRAFTDIPVLVLTAMDCPDNRLHALAIGADDFMSKPFHPDDIIARIDKIRERRG